MTIFSAVDEATFMRKRGSVCVRITEPQRRQIGDADLQHSDVRRGVRTDEAGGDFASIGQLHGDFRHACDHMVVAMGAVGAEANSCRQAGGLSQMPANAVAQFMAEAALKNVIAANE